VDFDPRLIAALRETKHVAVLTGAGVSAESGVPTFRDALTGLWSKFDPAQLATPQAFERDPELVTRWYDERRRNVANCKPNPGHVALAELQHHTESRGGTFTLITQNVDRLHQAAGSTNVIELHGSLWLWRCTRCGEEREERAADAPFATYPPRCESCNGPRRPGVVWFGESLPGDAIDQAQKASANCDLFLSLGTSSVVYPAAGLIDVAVRNGAKILEINPQETPYSSRAHWSLRGKTGELLPALVAAAGVS
jgi:NAD-dependent deacetylase